jgi:hypothetical protein
VDRPARTPLGVRTTRLPAPIRYQAEIAPVREVGLDGRADLGFWREQLRAEALQPADFGGQARLVVGAIDSSYRGIAFRELTIAVWLAPTGIDDDRDAVFLPRAYNSSRFFAFVERWWFGTPYEHAAIEVETSARPSFTLSREGAVLFRAALSEDGPSARARARSGEEGWEGPIVLPRREPGRNDDRTFFYGRIGGDTDVYPFRAQDAVTITPAARDDALRFLVESGFRGVEWVVRRAGTHARSRTFRTSTATRG